MHIILCAVAELPRFNSYIHRSHLIILAFDFMTILLLLLLLLQQKPSSWGIQTSGSLGNVASFLYLYLLSGIVIIQGNKKSFTVLFFHNKFKSVVKIFV